MPDAGESCDSKRCNFSKFYVDGFRRERLHGPDIHAGLSRSAFPPKEIATRYVGLSSLPHSSFLPLAYGTLRRKNRDTRNEPAYQPATEQRQYAAADQIYEIMLLGRQCRNRDEAGPDDRNRARLFSFLSQAERGQPRQRYVQRGRDQGSARSASNRAAGEKSCANHSPIHAGSFRESGRPATASASLRAKGNRSASLRICG
jgi:hypothetical protein